MLMRKIRNGRVKINGNWYVPSFNHIPYDSRLDGEKWVFAVYEKEDKFVSLWGSEAEYKAKTEEERVKLWSKRKDIIDGYFPWQWWVKVVPTERRG